VSLSERSGFVWIVTSDEKKRHCLEQPSRFVCLQTGEIEMDGSGKCRQRTLRCPKQKTLLTGLAWRWGIAALA